MTFYEHTIGSGIHNCFTIRHIKTGKYLNSKGEYQDKKAWFLSFSKGLDAMNNLQERKFKDEQEKVSKKDC